eukprot:8808964-Alexandrium_andersonii.AAC.1
MSASLVGSEMCIRDRGPLGKLLGRSREALGKLSGSCRGAVGKLSGSCRTVSYTHLTLPTICSV